MIKNFNGIIQNIVQIGIYIMLKKKVSKDVRHLLMFNRR